MAVVKKSKAVPVALAGMSGTEFRDKLNGLRKRAVGDSYRNVDLNNDFMINLDAKLFTGGTTINKQGETGYMSVPGSIGVNVATMCNLDPDLLSAMGVELDEKQAQAVQAGTSRHTGNFDNPAFEEFKTSPDGETYMKGTPVGLKVEFDPDINRGTELDKFRVTPAIDFRALGSASTTEQNNIRKTRGKAPLTASQEGRLKVTASYPVTKNGLGGMNVDRVSQNVAKCSAANSLMGATDPAKVPTADQVKGVSELYAQTYNQVVEALSVAGTKKMPKEGINGILPNAKGGITIPGIKEGSASVDCPSLAQMGLKAVQADGATVLAVDPKSTVDKQTRREGLKQFSEAFNAKWKQVVNERVLGEDGKPTGYAHDAATVAIGNQMNLNAHAVTVRNPENRDAKTSLVVVQPGMDYVMTPYADKLGASVGVAMHGLAEGTQPKDLFREDMMAATDALSRAFDGEEITAEVAIAKNKEQFEAIAKGIGSSYDDMIKEPVEETKANDGKGNDGPDID